MTARQTVTLAALGMAGISLASVVSYCAGRRQGIAAAQLRGDEASADSARNSRVPVVEAATRAVERVTQGKPMFSAARQAVNILDATTVEVRVTPSAEPQRLTVPPEVVRRFVQDSLHIMRLEAAVDTLQQLRVADSLVIQRLSVVIADLHAMKTPRCQAKCGALIMGAAIVGGGLVAKHAGDITEFLKGMFR